VTLPSDTALERENTLLREMLERERHLVRELVAERDCLLAMVEVRLQLEAHPPWWRRWRGR
jgi:hypothetical protein